MTKEQQDKHAKLLLEMLEFTNTCGRCPIEENDHCGETINNNRDLMCLKFLGINHRLLSLKTRNSLVTACPCYGLGIEEAIKRSWLALEEKGYLD